MSGLHGQDNSFSTILSLFASIIFSIQVQTSITGRVRGSLFRSATTFQDKQKQCHIKSSITSRNFHFCHSSDCFLLECFFSFIVTVQSYKSFGPMNQETQHRNKCQNCFKSIGKFILDCYCFLCLDCFQKIRSKSGNKCVVCFKPTTGKFIDTRDHAGMSKVNHLFGNYEASLNRCMDVYRFQNDVDLRYIKHLETQLSKYKELLSNIISENPRLKEYINNFFHKKATPKYKSVSENLQNYGNGHRERQNERSANDKYTNQNRKSSSTPSIQAHHEQIVDARPVMQGRPRDFSAKVPYRVPNINYNTALRSSKRPNRGDFDDDEMNQYRR